MIKNYNLDSFQMSISFSSSLPEVFEYPSYEAPTNVPSVANPTPLKSTNNSIGSFGNFNRSDPYFPKKN